MNLRLKDRLNMEFTACYGDRAAARGSADIIYRV